MLRSWEDRRKKALHARERRMSETACHVPQSPCIAGNASSSHNNTTHSINSRQVMIIIVLLHL